MTLLPWLMPETYLFLPCLRDSLILYHSYFSSVSLYLCIYYVYYNTTSLITLSKYSKFLLNIAKTIDIVLKTTYTILCNHIYQKHIIAMYAVHNYS